MLFSSFFSIQNSDFIIRILLLPLLSFFIIFLINIWTTRFIYQFAVSISGLSLLISFYLILHIQYNIEGFIENYYFNILPTFSFFFRLGLDGISIFFIVLTNLFIFLCIFSLSSSTFQLNRALCHLFFLQWSVICTFLFLDLLAFFIFFEITLIPIYFLVIIWGSRERRVRASYIIALYTLRGSIFMFFNILYIYSKTGTTDYELLLQIQLTKEDQLFRWLTFFIAFAAKIPLFPLHIWLPEAHVEAPTIGSVLLAVLRLKLGVYGLIRFCIPLFPEGTSFFAPIVIIFACIGIIYTCLTARRQIDLKKIIAYSSVGHINVVLLGIITETSESLQGAIFQRLSHGLVSGSLFFCVGVLYTRYSVRSFKYYSGLVYFYPLFTRIFLLFSLANISFPLTSSFIGEFYIFLGLLRFNFWATVFAATSIVLGAVYILWAFNRIFFGNISILSLNTYKDINKKERALFRRPIIFLFFRGLLPYYFRDTLFMDCINLLEHAHLNRY